MERPSTTEELRTQVLERTTQTRRRDEVPADGFVLGRYLLQRRLGAGGYGVVWQAWDERLERDVAVKVIPIEGDGPAPARAEREARVAAKLNHPGIVSLYEFGTDDEAVYLVSELVRGRTFAELLRGGGLSDRDVARIGIALCDALKHAHDKGVIHRDVKPQNVMVVAEPAAGAGFAKLTDFGVAHLAGGDALTRTGDVVGTLAYMAPEQAEGERVTSAADVYALALTLYEGWTGIQPDQGEGSGRHRAQSGSPPAISGLPAPRPARASLPGDRRRAGRAPGTAAVARGPAQRPGARGGRAVRRGRPGGARHAAAFRADRALPGRAISARTVAADAGGGRASAGVLVLLAGYVRSVPRRRLPHSRSPRPPGWRWPLLPRLGLARHRRGGAGLARPPPARHHDGTALVIAVARRRHPAAVAARRHPVVAPRAGARCWA